MSGKVFLVGAGPGDIGLMTIAGMEILRRADIVIYDALANHDLLKECENALKIDVGKRSNKHVKTQSEINKLLIESAEKGNIIVRLKGGDPFLFGRGAEEAASLRRAGIEVSVIPGVSSSIAVPELAGIPVTHRDHASMVTFVTGHEMERDKNNIDWKSLVKSHGTIVILMGMKNAENISASLIEGGMDPRTPVGVVINGSTDDQRTATTELVDLGPMIEREKLTPPGIIVIGNVVSEREILGDMS